ncbi:MAG TPA: transmembrane 220 family protein [Methylomirabilota bacterium]
MSVLKVANPLMGILFLFAVAVQYNDPDPVRWMAIYGLAALACVRSLAGRLRRPVPALIGLSAVAWAGTLAPGVVGRVSVGELFQPYAMMSETVEEAREMGGLLIVAAWMGLLALVGSRPA